jgi:hypothetical protein
MLSARTPRSPTPVKTSDVDGEDVAGADGVVGDFQLKLVGVEAQLLAHHRQLALADVAGQVDAERPRALREHGAALDEVEASELRHGLDVDVEAAAARRVEAVALKLDRHGRPRLIDEREEALADELEGRRLNVVRAALEEEETRRVGEHQRRQDGLQDEHGAAGRPDGELVLAGLDGARLEAELFGADVRAVGLGRADGGGGGDGRQVLTLQAGLVAPRPDVVDAERLARDERERQGRADDLPAALAV